jgi:general secretion pathway protein N
MIRSLRPVELALGLSCVVLLMLIGLVWSGVGHSPDWLPAQAPRDASTATQPAMAAAPVELQSMSNVWRQPLFSPDRSPDVSVRKEQQATSLSGFSLSGVIINGDLRVAFIRQKSGPALKVRQGEKLPNGWTLQQLSALKADFVLDDRTESLSLLVPRLPPPSTEPPISLPHETAPVSDRP